MAVIVPQNRATDNPEKVIYPPLTIKEATIKGYTEAYDGDSVNLEMPTSKTRRGRVGRQICNTLLTGCNVGVVCLNNPQAMENYGTASVMQIGNIVDDSDIGFKNPQRGRVYDTSGLSPAICTMTSGGTEPKILTPKRTDFDTTTIKKDNLLMTYGMNETEKIQDAEVTEVSYRIRKPTPRECYRLMGVDDADIDNIQAHKDAKGKPISNSQQYKMAGNSIVVDVLYHIFRKMFVEVESESRQLEFF